MLYDGDCGFCRLWIERWRAVTGDRVDYETAASRRDRFPEIPAESTERSVVLIETDGRVSLGAEAVLRALARDPSRRWMLRLYESLPGFSGVAESAYRFVAGRRRLFSRATRLLWGRTVAPPTYNLSCAVFLRAMGLVYLIAFGSLWLQIDGLYGSEGILPISDWLEAVREGAGPERYWTIPTWFWIDASDPSLHLACGVGVLASILTMLGVLTGPCLALAWTLYLSLVSAGGIFLRYQWDILLLEAGFLSILAASWRLRCRIGSCPQPPRSARLLIGWLLFRLVFASGVVKFTSGDPTWRGLTALDYHYETQPIPAWTSWYMHHMPGWFQTASLLSMFALELAVPFLLVAPRRIRHLALLLLVGLQTGFALTGNYGFFNLLSAVLCLPLLDDAAWPEFARRRLVPALPGTAGHRRLRAWLTLPIALVLAVLGAKHLVRSFRVPAPWPRIVEWTDQATEPFHLSNGYGLFAVMTTSRPEIIVEGSADGETWLPYELKWKPGEPARRPGFVAPHMPRLDWQMWFAALGNFQSAPWFSQFAYRLLTGSHAVIGLLERNPFPDEPPVFIRGAVYEYHFTEPGDPSGDWWRREPKGPYTPVLKLKADPPSR